MQYVENCIGRCRETEAYKSCGFTKQDVITFCHLLRTDRYKLPQPTPHNPTIISYYEAKSCNQYDKDLVKYSVPHAKDCKDVYKRGFTETGVYKVGEFYKYCEMNYLGGGWTVVEKRFNGAVNFTRTWNAYREGFGNLRNEFWLGNEYLHLLTKDTENEVLFILKKFNDVTEYMALYDGFSVDDESTRYKLTTGTYTEDGIASPAGDSFSYHDGEDFNTFDSDNALLCAQRFSAWWTKACHFTSLNGVYSTNGSCQSGKCIHLHPFLPHGKSLEEATMMVRKKN
ncbi:microfibril-associated glycoprotein 4-like [Hydractinia symbiolongicarpus]|uniref:microfibril-associated glycoprotein 4-like n=1 Tax=Hydractinia symbiolongicarpus TaxID=13093 RepID=UPI00254D430E|nr:microfibril-associated glycoprotein 4-like [Hydractinia symbiolongicarpus]